MSEPTREWRRLNTPRDRLRYTAHHGANAPGYSLDRIDADLDAIAAEAGRDAEIKRERAVFDYMREEALRIAAEKQCAKLREALWGVRVVELNIDGSPCWCPDYPHVGHTPACERARRALRETA